MAKIRNPTTLMTPNSMTRKTPNQKRRVNLRLRSPRRPMTPTMTSLMLTTSLVRRSLRRRTASPNQRRMERAQRRTSLILTMPILTNLKIRKSNQP